MMKRWVALELALILLVTVGFTAFAGAQIVEPITLVRVNHTSMTIFAGTSFTLKATISPTSRANEPVTFTSSDTAVADVDSNGVVTARSPGSASIAAAAGGMTAYCEVTVKAAPVQSFKISNTSIALGMGDTFQLSPSTFVPAYAYDKTITWSSQIERIASVNPVTGLVTAVSPGKTRVTAKSHNGRTQLCTVTVTGGVRARSVKLSSTAKVMSNGQTFSLTATVLPATAMAEDRVITWGTSNAQVATVDPNGVVTAKNTSGTCSITATSGNGRKAVCKITVKHIPTKSVALSNSSITIGVGDTQKLTATVSPANASNRDVAWQSDNSSVATVEDGKVTAHKGGVATITASAGGKSAKCKVTVGSGSSDMRTVTITATGDITIGGDPRKQQAVGSEKHYEKLYAAYSGGFLSNLRNTFSGSDEVTLVNLESNLTTATKYKQKTYVLRAKPAYADVLSRAGVEVVGHANNHSIDFGTVGAADTRRAVASHNMLYCAGGTTAVSEVNGVSVGFCAFNATGGSVTTAMKNAVTRLKKQSDIVVVSIHWGNEFVYAANTAQRNLGRAAVLAGADLVVGHHSHVVSGIEQYKGKYIVYSLGTLSSALLTPKDMDVFVYQQTFNVDRATGQAESAKVKLIPCSMSGDDKTNNGRPVILTGAARTRVMNKIKNYSKAFTATVPASSFE